MIELIEVFVDQGRNDQFSAKSSDNLYAMFGSYHLDYCAFLQSLNQLLYTSLSNSLTHLKSTQKLAVFNFKNCNLHDMLVVFELSLFACERP